MTPPPISKELLDHLKALYPDQAPKLTDGIREIRHKAGQVSVVQYLQSCYDVQNEPSS